MAQLAHEFSSLFACCSSCQPPLRPCKSMSSLSTLLDPSRFACSPSCQLPRLMVPYLPQISTSVLYFLDWEGWSSLAKISLSRHQINKTQTLGLAMLLLVTLVSSRHQINKTQSLRLRMLLLVTLVSSSSYGFLTRTNLPNLTPLHQAHADAHAQKYVHKYTLKSTLTQTGTYKRAHTRSYQHAYDSVSKPSSCCASPTSFNLSAHIYCYSLR